MYSLMPKPKVTEHNKGDEKTNHLGTPVEIISIRSMIMYSPTSIYNYREYLVKFFMIN